MNVRTVNLNGKIEKLLPFITYKAFLLERKGEKINDLLCQAYNLSKIYDYLVFSFELSQQDISEEVFIKYSTLISDIESCYDINNLEYPAIPAITTTTVMARVVVTTTQEEAPSTTQFNSPLPPTTNIPSTTVETTTEYSLLPSTTSIPSTTVSTTIEYSLLPSTTTVASTTVATTVEYSPLPSTTTAETTTVATTTEYSALPSTTEVASTTQGTTTEYSPLPEATTTVAPVSTTLPSFSGELNTTETTSGTTTVANTTVATTAATTAQTTLASTTATTTAATTTVAPTTTASTTASTTTVATTTAATTTAAPTEMLVYVNTSSQEACNKAVLEQGTPVTVYITGSNLCDAAGRIFSDAAMTTPFNTGSNWIASWLDGCAVQTNATGYITAVQTCEDVTTTTTGTTSSTTCACPSVIMISDFHANQTAACADITSGLPRCSTDATVIVGSIISDDCCEFVATGFYKIVPTGQYIEVGASGEVIAIGTC